jgi:hypothetical protein
VDKEKVFECEGKLMPAATRTVAELVGHEANAGVHEQQGEFVKERITVRLPTVLHERLEELRGITHASNTSEVLKSALLFYDALVKERLRGNDVYVISKDGEKIKYPVFYD